MRWVPWLLGIVGVVQYGIIAWTNPEEYVSVDMAYLVMWLCIIGALIVCYMSCYGNCGYGGYDGGCDCCGDDCRCGDCDCCLDDGPEGMDGDDHRGHTH